MTWIFGSTLRAYSVSNRSEQRDEFVAVLVVVEQLGENLEWPRERFGFGTEVDDGRDHVFARGDDSSERDVLFFLVRDRRIDGEREAFEQCRSSFGRVDLDERLDRFETVIGLGAFVRGHFGGADDLFIDGGGRARGGCRTFGILTEQ
jgi:hypothetical protein